MTGKANKSIWVGRALSALVVTFLIIDGAMKLGPAQIVIDTSREFELPTDSGTLRILGVILLASTALYAFPRTAILGAILLTGYLGGAVASHMRIGSPLFSHILFGVYLGVILWGGLWFRYPRVRALLPISR